MEQTGAAVEKTPVAEVTGTTYRLTDEILEQRFSIGDAVNIPVKDKDDAIKLVRLDDGLTISLPDGDEVLKLGEERTIDLDGDANMDIKIFVRVLTGTRHSRVLCSVLTAL